MALPIPDKLAEDWDAVKDGANVSKPSLSRTIDDVGDTVATMQSDATPFMPIIKDTIAAAEKTVLGKTIQDKIVTFSEGVPVFMNALDQLGKIHPFIEVVVLAFKTAYTLHQKRRDNDKKVISLYVVMKDMMSALFRLKDVENDKLTAPDGTTIEDRLKSLVDRTADDIKTCSNLCDTYTKKRPLAKVLMSPIWDGKLLDFAKLFAQRRDDFQFELTLNTSQGVNKANTKLDAIEDATGELSKQMNEMRSLFQQIVSPEQKRLSEMVEEKGGVKAFLGNERAFLDLENAVRNDSSQYSVASHRTSQAKPGDADLEVESLKKDVLEDPNAAAEKNWTVFTRKFEAQKNQIIDKLALVVRREGDRIIREVHGSAHERILDQSIHDIWVEMGWRGHVKARNFVLTLRDYYLENLRLSETGGAVDLGPSLITGSSNPDAWAIKYISLTWAQPILEAFDDDASGFITIAEVNAFTSSRPVGWSLPHWWAFWAVGFEWSIMDYARKMEDLFAKMEGVRTTVLPPNGQPTDRYFGAAWLIVHSLTSPILSLDLSDSVLADLGNFKHHIEAEEKRLENNLRAVNYVIDGNDTLTLITGGGRIEKTLFPLLYLLLKRQYEIMRMMRTKVVDERDCMEAMDSIWSIHAALIDRKGDLLNNFTQQRLDPEKQWENFAYGIFKYVGKSSALKLWTVDYVRRFNPEAIPYNDDNEDKNVQPGDVLKREYKDELSLDDWVYDGHSIDDLPEHRDVEPPLKDILGHWHGYSYDEQGVHAMWVPSMITFVLVPGNGEGDISAKAWTLQGRSSITGTWSKGGDDIIKVTLKMVLHNCGSLITIFFFNGHFDADRNALTGVWNDSSDLENARHIMEFRRIPPHYLAVYPDIKELSDNKPRSLWRFAIAAVRNDVRRDHWSWPYFSQRRDDRESMIPLLLRELYFGPDLSDEEKETYRAIALRLTPGDCLFYESKARYIRGNICVHWCCCCSCDGVITGARLFCLDCVIEDKLGSITVDLCTRPQCTGARITQFEGLESPHEPTHRLIKVRTRVMLRNYGRVYTEACEAFERVQEFCLKIAESSSHSHGDESPGPNTSGIESTSTEVGAQNDDIRTGPDRTEGGTEENDKTTPHAIQDQDLPTCGQCKRSLSFPFWYCIFCENNLFICDACDTRNVLDVLQSSGKHTEDHHLIRCLAPEKADDEVSPTEQRLTLIEGRLNGMHTEMQTQRDDLIGRLNGMQTEMQTQRDDLTGRLNDLTARIGNIEKLLLRLAGAPGTVA